LANGGTCTTLGSDRSPQPNSHTQLLGYDATRGEVREEAAEIETGKVEGAGKGDEGQGANRGSPRKVWRTRLVNLARRSTNGDTAQDAVSDEEILQINEKFSRLLNEQISHAELLELLKRIDPGLSLSLDDLNGDISVEYYREGDHKLVFRLVFHSRDNRPVVVKMAVKKAKSPLDITQAEIDYQRRLEALGIRVPRFAGQYTLAEDGTTFYFEEFIPGPTAEELYSEGKLTTQIRKAVAGLLLTMLLATGIAPSDVHRKNFIIHERTGEAVFVDAGARRMSRLSNLLGVITKYYGYLKDDWRPGANFFIYDAVLEAYAGAGRREEALDSLRQILAAREKVVVDLERSDEGTMYNLAKEEWVKLRDELREYLARFETSPPQARNQPADDEQLAKIETILELHSDIRDIAPASDGSWQVQFSDGRRESFGSFAELEKRYLSQGETDEGGHSFEALFKENASPEGEAIAGGLLFAADALPEAMVSGLEAAGVRASPETSRVIAVIQRYFQMIRRMAPDKTRDISSYQIEFRRNVQNYAIIRGNKIILDVELLNVDSEHLLAFLTFILGHEGSHAIVGAEAEARAMDKERFDALSPAHQASVIAVLRHLGVARDYLDALSPAEPEEEPEAEPDIEADQAREELIENVWHFNAGNEIENQQLNIQGFEELINDIVDFNNLEFEESTVVAENTFVYHLQKLRDTIFRGTYSAGRRAINFFAALPGNMLMVILDFFNTPVRRFSWRIVDILLIPLAPVLQLAHRFLAKPANRTFGYLLEGTIAGWVELLKRTQKKEGFSVYLRDAAIYTLGRITRRYVHGRALFLGVRAELTKSGDPLLTALQEVEGEGPAQDSLRAEILDSLKGIIYLLPASDIPAGLILTLSALLENTKGDDKTSYYLKVKIAETLEVIANVLARDNAHVKGTSEPQKQLTQLLLPLLGALEGVRGESDAVNFTRGALASALAEIIRITPIEQISEEFVVRVVEQFKGLKGDSDSLNYARSGIARIFSAISKGMEGFSISTHHQKMLTWKMIQAIAPLIQALTQMRRANRLSDFVREDICEALAKIITWDYARIPEVANFSFDGVDSTQARQVRELIRLRVGVRLCIRFPEETLRAFNPAFFQQHSRDDLLKIHRVILNPYKKHVLSEEMAKYLMGFESVLGSTLFSLLTETTDEAKIEAISKFLKEEDSNINEAILFLQRTEIDKSGNFLKELLRKRDASCLDVILEIKEGKFFKDKQFQGLIKKLIESGKKYEVVKEALAIIAHTYAVMQGASLKKGAFLKAADASLEAYLKGKFGDKRFLSQIRELYAAKMSEALGTIIGSRLNGEFREFLAKNAGLMEQLATLVGVYVRVKKGYPDTAKKISAALKELVRMRDLKAFNRWIFTEAEWNRESYQRLIRAGYSPLLWQQGLSKTVPAQAGTKDQQEKIRQQTFQLLEFAQKYGIAYDRSITGLDSLELATRFAGQYLLSNADVSAEDREHIISILKETRRLEEEYQKQAEAARVRVDVGFDFFGDASSGVGVPGCFNPTTGIHKEMPLMHALETDTMFLRIYKDGKMIANAVLILTPEGVVVQPLYNATNLDLDAVVFDALADLLLKGWIPKALMRGTSAGYKAGDGFLRNEPQTAKKPRIVSDHYYFDFGSASSGFQTTDVLERAALEAKGYQPAGEVKEATPEQIAEKEKKQKMKEIKTDARNKLFSLGFIEIDLSPVLKDLENILFLYSEKRIEQILESLKLKNHSPPDDKPEAQKLERIREVILQLRKDYQDFLATKREAFGALEKEGGVPAGEPIHQSLLFVADAPAEEIAAVLEGQGIISAQDITHTIETIQRYFRSIRIRAPGTTRDISGYQIEFRRNVRNYAIIQGNKITLDIDLLTKVASQDILALLTFILGHEGSHAIVEDEYAARDMDQARFRSFHPRHQQAVVRALQGLNVDPLYLLSLIASISHQAQDNQKRSPEPKPLPEISRPLADPQASGLGEVKNILVLYEAFRSHPITPQPKFGEELVNMWALVTTLWRQFPEATIYVASPYSEIYLAKQFRGRIKPLKIEDVEADAKIGELIRQNRIDTAFNISPAPHALRHFKGDVLPNLFEIPSASSMSSAMHDIMHRLTPAYFRDRNNKIHRLGGEGELLTNLFGDLAHEYEDGGRLDMPLGEAGIWRLSIEMCRQLGLEVSRDDLFAISLDSEESRKEARDGVRLLEEMYNLQHAGEPNAPKFDRMKKIVVVNVYAITQAYILDENDWTEGLLALIQGKTVEENGKQVFKPGIKDAYFVFSGGGPMDTDMTLAASIAQAVQRRMSGSPNGNEIILPRRALYPHINDLLGIASAVVSPDTGFSHFANGVYGIPSAVVIPPYLNWLPPRRNVTAVTIPQVSFAQLRFLEESYDRNYLAQAGRGLKQRRMVASMLYFAEQVNQQAERPTVIAAKLATFTPIERYNLDRDLLKQRLANPRVEAQLRAYLEESLAVLGLPESLIPEIVLVDSAAQLKCDMPRFRVKLFTDTAGNKTYLLIDKSLVPEGQAGDQTRDFSLMHEVLGHCFVRQTLERTESGAAGVMVRKTEEEILAQLATLLFIQRLRQLRPELVNSQVRQRAQEMGLDIDASAVDAELYLKAAIKGVQTKEDLSAQRYQEVLASEGEELEQRIRAYYLPVIMQACGHPVPTLILPSTKEKYGHLPQFVQGWIAAVVEFWQAFWGILSFVRSHGEQTEEELRQRQIGHAFIWSTQSTAFVAAMVCFGAFTALSLPVALGASLGIMVLANILTHGTYNTLAIPFGWAQLNIASASSVKSHVGLPQANTAVAAKLKAEIKRRGRVTFKEFMEASLYDPEGGYYTSGTVKIGSPGQGHFSTFPEMFHPHFGNALARQLREMWENMGRPSAFDIVEMGAGNGTMARDILEAARQESPDFFRALRYKIIEISSALRQRQEETISQGEDGAGYAGKLEHINEEDLEAVEGVILSNELPDAMPVHRVKLFHGTPAECYVKVDENGNFRETWDIVSSPLIIDYLNKICALEGVRDFEELFSASPDAEIAVNLGALSWYENISLALKRGYILTIDYGLIETSFRQQFATVAEGKVKIARAVRTFSGHESKAEDVYLYPGGVDITSDVYFPLLRALGIDAGLSSEGYITQQRFLTNLGADKTLFERLPSQDSYFVFIQSKGLRQGSLKGLQGSIDLSELGREELARLRPQKELVNQEDVVVDGEKKFTVAEEREGYPDELGARETPKAASKVPGGIDLRRLPVAIQAKSAGAPVFSSQAKSGPDPEWQEMQGLLNSGIIPSVERIREYVGASCDSNDCAVRIERALVCLADTLRLEEETGSPTGIEIKELLVLLESGTSPESIRIQLGRNN
ncbi:MAG: hypothetical protein FJZ09_06725, partial [Candidatus Omnitrophica bacterium]|nr:hypothetical protein [Candidatus Omnitrophota bacterium]